MAAYTPFKTKYGYLDGYENSNKSGLTPTQHLFPGNLTDPRLEDQIKQKEKIQQEALFGWTTRELADLDCLTIRDAKTGDLESLPTIPLLDRPVWERSPAPDFARTYMYVLKDSQGGGDFSAHNDPIWEALKPALKIASVYLSSIYMLPFWDALLNGPRELIPENRKMPPDKGSGPFYSFCPPDRPTQPYKISQQRDSVFDDLRINKRLQIGFMTQDESPEDPAEPLSINGMLHGYTTVNTEYMNSEPKEPNAAWRVFIFLDLISMERLLEDDLNSSERVLIEWYIALVLSHEIIHAVEYLPGINMGGWTEETIQKNYDSYYMDQSVPEVGWCFEKEINGGIQEKMGKKELKFTRGLQLGHFFIPTWPSMRSMHVRDDGTIILVNPHPSDYDIRYPVPMSLMEDVQQQQFWDVGVRNFGIQLLFYRVFKIGTRTNYVYNDKKKLVDEPPDPYTKEGRASLCTTIEQSVTSTVSHLKQLAVLTPEQRTLAQFGHDLILSSNRESQFWKASRNKSDAMNRINEILYRDPRVRAPIQGLGILFNDVLPQAIQNHENMVALMIDMEDERQSANSERRKSLVEWNKGTSSFVRKMVREVQSTNPNTQIPEVDNLLIKLEKERLRLSNSSPSNDTTDKDELEQLRLNKCRTLLVSSDPSMSEAKEIESLANTVLGNEDSTLFAISCAKILIPVLGRHIAEGWYERARVGVEGMETFKELNIGGFWKAEIDAWQGMLMQVAQIGPPKT